VAWSGSLDKALLRLVLLPIEFEAGNRQRRLLALGGCI
jgi:hypothetical protein